MDGGGEWGGAAWDPARGLLYVNANEMAWTVRLKERPLPDGTPTARSSTRGTARPATAPTAAARRPEFPSLVDIARRRSVDEIATVVREGAGRMPGASHLHGAVRRAIVEYVVSGRSNVVKQDAPTPFDVRYSLDGEVRFTDPDGFPAVTPPWGTLTALDLNAGTIAWQVPSARCRAPGSPPAAAKLWGPGGDGERSRLHRGHDLRRRTARV